MDGEHGFHDLHFVTHALGEKRAQRAVDEAGGQNGVRTGPAFAAEEGTGNFTCCVGAFFHIHRQREEIEVFLRAFRSGGGGENGGFPVQVGQGGAVGLLG